MISLNIEASKMKLCTDSSTVVDFGKLAASDNFFAAFTHFMVTISKHQITYCVLFIKSYLNLTLPELRTGEGSQVGPQRIFFHKF